MHYYSDYYTRHRNIPQEEDSVTKSVRKVIKINLTYMSEAGRVPGVCAILENYETSMLPPPL